MAQQTTHVTLPGDVILLAVVGLGRLNSAGTRAVGDQARPAPCSGICWEADAADVPTRLLCKIILALWIGRSHTG